MGLGRVAITKQISLVTDLMAEQAYIDRHPFAVQGVELGGIRTLLAVPMLKESQLVGGIVIYRQEVRPFTDKQIELVQNFAAQAVIAIENARLLNELRQRTDDLTESLEQQTATSRGPEGHQPSRGELDPMFEAMLQNAVRLCEAKFGVLWLAEGEGFRSVALHGVPSALAEARRREPFIGDFGPHSAIGRVLRTRQVVQIGDYMADPGYIERDPRVVSLVENGKARSVVAAPLLNELKVVGVLIIYRQEVRPFTESRSSCLPNFAAQAVIAIENTRLLSELRESLEQQTATSEVLKVISSSPGELAPVFSAMLANATRICEANFGIMTLHEDGWFRAVACTMHLRNLPKLVGLSHASVSAERSALSRTVQTGQPQCVLDLREDETYLAGDPGVRHDRRSGWCAQPDRYSDDQRRRSCRCYRHLSRRRSARSPISRSSWCRTSPRRP